MKFFKTPLAYFFLVLLLFRLSSDQVFSSALIGSWERSRDLPYLTASHTAFVYNNDRIYVMGGGVSELSTITSAEVGSFGDLSNWMTLARELPEPLVWHSTVLYGDRVYLLGGANSTSEFRGVNKVYVATVQDDGEVSAWQQINDLPGGRALGGAAIFRDRIYYMGGGLRPSASSSQQEIQPAIYSANISSDGTIGSWRTELSLPRPLMGFALFVSDAGFIVAGGVTTGNLAVSDVYYAQVRGDGLIDSWDSYPSLPKPLHRPGFSKINRFLVIAGGHDGISANLRDVYVSTLQLDGRPGEWEIDENSLSNVNCCSSMVPVKDYLFLIGGYTSGYTNEVWRTSLALPTSTPAPRSPVVVVPGMGASWSREGLILGEETGPSDWYFPWFVHHYDGLIERLEEAGYEEGEDLFVFNYDWTQSVSRTASQLAEYIDGVVDPPAGEASDKKVDVVGHSLGGLVGRVYVQENPAHQVGKLITLGTPHKGVVQAYYAWEGADFSRLLSPWFRIPVGLLLRARSGVFSTPVDAVRNLSPSLRDILPVFDYLKKGEGEIIGETEMNQQNTWLKSLGEPESLADLLIAVLGNSLVAPRWLEVIPRDWVDELMGRWEDGKPIGQEEEVGDKTVLVESAEYPGAERINLSLSHTGLVTDEVGQETVIELLGEEAEAGTTVFNVEAEGEEEEENLLAIFVDPIVPFKVIDPEGREAGNGANDPLIPEASYSEEEGGIIIPYSMEGDYRIELEGENAEEVRVFFNVLGKEGDLNLSLTGERNYSVPVGEGGRINEEQVLEVLRMKLEGLRERVEEMETKKSVKAVLLARISKIEKRLDKIEQKPDKAGKEWGKGVKTAGKLMELIETWQTKGEIEAEAGEELVREVREVIYLLDWGYGVGGRK